jgi:hypothetical protein
MRIRYARSGGLANIPLEFELDSKQVSGSKARDLKQLIEKARLFEQPAKPPISRSAPDQHQYELTVEEGGRTHTIRTSDMAASPELLSLLDWLSGEAVAKLKKKAGRS